MLRTLAKIWTWAIPFIFLLSANIGWEYIYPDDSYAPDVLFAKRDFWYGANLELSVFIACVLLVKAISPKSVIAYNMGAAWSLVWAFTFIDEIFGDAYIVSISQCILILITITVFILRIHKYLKK